MRFDRLATFERYTPPNELDDSGGTWATLFRTWIALQPLTGRELLNSQQVVGQVTHRVRTHWDSNVQVADRLTVGDRILNITSVINPGEQNRELELLCVEVV